MRTSIKNLMIIPGCISCGACKAICPEVFELEKSASIKDNVDFDKYEEKIREVSDMCPVQVIKIINKDNV